MGDYYITQGVLSMSKGIFKILALFLGMSALVANEQSSIKDSSYLRLGGVAVYESLSATRQTDSKFSTLGYGFSLATGVRNQMATSNLRLLLANGKTKGSQSSNKGVVDEAEITFGANVASAHMPLYVVLGFRTDKFSAKNRGSTPYEHHVSQLLFGFEGYIPLQQLKLEYGLNVGNTLTGSLFGDKLSGFRDISGAYHRFASGLNSLHVSIGYSYLLGKRAHYFTRLSGSYFDLKPLYTKHPKTKIVSAKIEIGFGF